MSEGAGEGGGEAPIGVFDSGLGGLTVVRELLAAMPAEHVVYLGDSARVPYGTKSPETIRRFALQDLAFLLRFAPKLVVVACNTASAAALDALRAASAVEVVDVIRPGAAAAVAATSGAIGVIGTEATVGLGAYERAVAAIDPARRVVAKACPLLVPIVEEGRDDDDPIILKVLYDYLRDMQRLRVEALILGCTHYPLLAAQIAKVMGPSVALISSAAAAALEVQRRLCSTGRSRAGEGGTLRCFTTDSPERFARLGRRFAARGVGQVRRVGTDELESYIAAEGRRS